MSMHRQIAQMMRAPAPPVGGGVLLRDEFDGVAGTSLYSHTPDETAIPGAAWGDFYGERNDDFQIDGTGRLELLGPDSATLGWVGIGVPAVNRRSVLESTGKSNYYNMAILLLRETYGIGYYNRNFRHAEYNGSSWNLTTAASASEFEYGTAFTVESIDTGTNIHTIFTDTNGIYYEDDWAIPDPTIDGCIGLYTRTTDDSVSLPFDRFQVDAI